LRARSDSDDEEPLQKKASQSLGPGTGLSCLLPQPRHLPLSEADREPSPAPCPFLKRPGRIPAPARVTAAPSPSAIKAASKSAAKQLARHIMSEKASDGEEEVEEEEEEEVGGGPAGFFSLSDPPAAAEGSLLDPNPADAPLEFNRGTLSVGDAAPTDPVPSYLDYAAQGAEYSDYYQNYSNYYQGLDPTLAPAPEEELNTFMNDEAFKRLQGKRNRSKEEVSFVEIKGDDQLSGSQQWLMKSLTEEKDLKSFSKVWHALPHYQCWECVVQAAFVSRLIEWGERERDGGGERERERDG
ncbi:proline-rich protein PRCC, partial [Narcine bancroftii]|uniref:proline-rich protein PRCC n=1 Tax=Narcine bancroftii TaxID=1343680 RepID=UPI003831C0C0